MDPETRKVSSVPDEIVAPLAVKNQANQTLPEDHLSRKDNFAVSGAFLRY